MLSVVLPQLNTNVIPVAEMHVYDQLSDSYVEHLLSLHEASTNCDGGPEWPPRDRQNY